MHSIALSNDGVSKGRAMFSSRHKLPNENILINFYLHTPQGFSDFAKNSYPQKGSFRLYYSLMLEGERGAGQSACLSAALRIPLVLPCRTPSPRIGCQ